MISEGDAGGAHRREEATSPGPVGRGDPRGAQPDPLRETPVEDHRSRGRPWWEQGVALALKLEVGTRSWGGGVRLDTRSGLRPLVLGILCVALGLLLLGSLGVLAVRGWRVPSLESEVARLEVEREHVEGLEALLAEVEDAYTALRSLFAPESRAGGAGAIQLPSPAAGGGGAVGASDAEGPLPTTWPLTEAGFLTQPLVEGAGADHPGIDVAASTGSYIRAAGPGRVVEAAEDPVYGLYLVLDHGGGYRSLYAHASHLLVEAGQMVVRGEVVALSGSTGRSTAPHLHFEILRDGEPLDPLSLLRRP
jgi:hypothetical protein